jgi:hypothetical protein
MDNEIIKSLRNRSFIKGKQKTWVSDLTDEQLWTIFVKIKNGETNTEIARHIQEKLGVMSESSMRSVAQAIGKFKKRVGDISLLPAPKEIEEMGGLEGLRVAQKALTESIKHKGPGNANLAKESKVLLEINVAIEKLEEKEQELNDPENFAKIAAEKIKNLDKENTEKWVNAVLAAAEKKLNAVYWVEIFFDLPDEISFKCTRTIISNACEKLCYALQNEPEKFEVVKFEDLEIEK